MTKTVLEVLTEARNLIADPEHWTYNTHAVDSDGVDVTPTNRAACAWCASGAVAKITRGFGKGCYDEATDLLSGAARSLFPDVTRDYHAYVPVNDGEVGVPDDATGDRGIAIAHTNIIKVFDAAIEQAKAGASA